MTILRRSVSIFALVALCAQVTSVAADPDAGSYLAARHANAQSDFASEARYFTTSLMSDPGNKALREQALTAFIALGQIDRAIPIAQVIVDNGQYSQMAHLALFLKAISEGAWDDVFTGLEKGQSVAPLVDGLTQAWAHLGEGDMKKAVASFDQVIEGEGMALYGMTHKAFALASVGDFEGALDVYNAAADAGMLRYNAESAMAHGQILSQLGRNSDALAVIDSVFGQHADSRVSTMRADLRAGVAVPFDVVGSPADGIAELLYGVAVAVKGEAPDDYTLLYARAAAYLNPAKTQATLMSAELLYDLRQYDLANEAYASISVTDPEYHAAELGRAEVLMDAGRADAAIEVLDALARSHPDLPQVHASKGDTLRRNKRFTEAAAAYTKALEIYDSANPVRWFVHYTRGIAFHKTDSWAAAEADFRAALELRPDQPQVLNYLGYSLVERGEKLDEALQMIETAAAARPDNGAIIDSLGWVLFQLGRYEEAVVHLERAAALEPVDPVINDHLGDVYWAVGRETEAHFQWHRALSFDPIEEDAMRIRRKLSRGLDAVLREEGLSPIRVASGDD